MPAGLGRGGPAGSGAEVVHAGLGDGGVDLGLRVRGAADHHALADDGAGCGDRQVSLAEVEHVGPDGVGDIGPVVHCEQFAVAPAGVGEDRQVFELLGRLHALVAQLDDVHPGGEHGVEEGGQVALAPAGIRAQIEPGVGQQLARRGHGEVPP